MEIDKQEWNSLKKDVESIKLTTQRLLDNRGHTAILIMLIILVLRGC